VTPTPAWAVLRPTPPRRPWAPLLAARQEQQPTSRVEFTAPCACGRLTTWESIRNPASSSDHSTTTPICTCTTGDAA